MTWLKAPGARRIGGGPPMRNPNFGGHRTGIVKLLYSTYNLFLKDPFLSQLFIFFIKYAPVAIKDNIEHR